MRLLMACLIGSAAAFAPMPASRLTAGRVLATQRTARVAPMQMAVSDWVPRSLKNAASGLFGGRKAVPQRTGKAEGVALFRQIGVSEDATYEEIDDAVKRLKEKYASDKKQCIRLDKLKDEIMDLRLKQRMSKSSARSAGVIAAEQTERALEKGKRKQFKLPAWTKGWLLLPDKDYLLMNLYTFSFFAVCMAMFPSAERLWGMASALYCAVKMTQREAPPAPSDEEGRMNPNLHAPTTSCIVATVLVTGIATLIAMPMGKALTASFGEEYIVAEAWRLIAAQFNYFVVASLFSTWRKK